MDKTYEHDGITYHLSQIGGSESRPLYRVIARRDGRIVSLRGKRESRVVADLSAGQWVCGGWDAGGFVAPLTSAGLDYVVR